MGLAAVLAAVLAMALVGCVGAETLGDRAMERGSPQEALDYYEQAIADDPRNPDLYYRAARAAQQQGAFARAERLFSQSLRYGGGVDVARALAEFYIQTSNYAQAVQVFRYLIQIEENEEAIPPLYSNLGTALMYAGQYIDAESYLVLAQQTEPANPVPYLNLGLLYDRHLRNRPKAVEFYECFAEMSDDDRRVRTVRTRLREIENQRAVDTSRVNLECGEEYRASEPQEYDLAEELSLGATEELPTDPVIERLNLEVPLDYEPESRGEQSQQLGAGSAGEDREESSTGEELEIVDATEVQRQPDDIEQARQAYGAGRYDEAVERLEQLPESERSADATLQAMLGAAYYQTGRFQQAVEPLESALGQEPTPEIAQRLLSVYDRLDEMDEHRRICERFDGWPDYEQALEQNCD